MIQDLVLLYLGGSLAIALACLAMFRQPGVGDATRQHGRTRSLREAMLLSAVWLPAMLVFVLVPKALTPRKRRNRRQQ